MKGRSQEKVKVSRERREGKQMVEMRGSKKSGSEGKATDLRETGRGKTGELQVLRAGGPMISGEKRRRR